MPGSNAAGATAMPTQATRSAPFEKAPFPSPKSTSSSGESTHRCPIAGGSPSSVKRDDGTTARTILDGESIATVQRARRDTEVAEGPLEGWPETGDRFLGSLD